MISLGDVYWIWSADCGGAGHRLQHNWEGQAVVLYTRITQQGTLSEPKGVPDPQFSLPGTINWMRALALLVKDAGLDYPSAQAFYASIAKRPFSTHEENTIFEQLLFSLHQVSALEALRPVLNQADVARVAIVAWYYGVYSAASAMIAAQDGSLQDDHAGTAIVWDRQFAQRGMVMPPFDMRVSTLVEKDVEAEIGMLRAGNTSDLRTEPLSAPDARGALCAYLSGNAGFFKWRVEQDIRESKEFKALGVTNFRSGAARQLRDERLKKRVVCFVHQAIRYRGKANYREALFLGHGRHVETQLKGYIDDLALVLTAFVVMAGAYVSRRLGSPLWGDFIEDLEKQRSFTVGPKSIWP